jgi:hypothetical protein
VWVAVMPVAGGATATLSPARAATALPSNQIVISLGDCPGAAGRVSIATSGPFSRTLFL